MKVKSAMKAEDAANRKESVKIAIQPSELEEENKAWSLTQQLKSRMKALSGGGK